MRHQDRVKYEIIENEIARLNQENDRRYTGKLCESGEILYKSTSC
jgi:hypothetical protein